MRKIYKQRHKTSRTSPLQFAVYLFIFMIPAFYTPAHAQLAGTDTVIGDSCAGFPTGASRLTADGDGADIVLICDGSVWRPLP